MQDEMFLTKYLEESYKVSFLSGSFCFMDKITHKQYSMVEFTEIFNTIFSTWETDDGRTPIEICQKWFDTYKYEIGKPIYDLLSKCNVRLGDDSPLVLYEDGSIINEISIQDIIGDKAEMNVVKYIYKNWLRIKVEKLLGNYLEKCKVILGPYDWIVKHESGALVTQKSIIKITGDNEGGAYSSAIYNRWYQDNMEKTSREIMGIYD